MSTHSVSKLVGRVEHLQNRLKRVRDEGESVTGRAMDAVATLAGGAAVGAIDGLFGPLGGQPGTAMAGPALVPGTQIELTLALGSALQLAAIAGFAGKNSNWLNSFAGGMLAVHLAMPINKAVASVRSK